MRQSRETFAYRVQFRVPGGVWVWVKGTSQTMDPSQATIFASKEDAEQVAARIQGPRSSLQARVVPAPVGYAPNDSYSPFAGHERLLGGRADYGEMEEHADDPELETDTEDGAYYGRGGFESNTTKTRYIGFCPVCERYIKCHHVRGKHVLVHHGYERPGEGYIVGDCFGVGHEPHEVSPALAQLYIEELQRSLSWLNEKLEEVPFLTTRTFTDHNRKVQTITRDDFGWGRHLDQYKYDLEYRLKETQRDLKRMERHVETWQPLPMKTVEEEMEQVQRQKQERSTQLAAERAQKRAELIASVQKRIDSAVRNQNMSALASIYESLYRNYPDKLKLDKQGVLEAVDRPHVWRAFGLLDGIEYLFPVWRRDQKERDPIERQLWRMSSGYGDPEILRWPAELGEPKRKQRKNAEHEPNAGYYVWVLGADGYPLQTEGPHGPHDLQGAKTYARIAATEGRHDRAVSRGRDPETSSFEVVRAYRAGTGERAV